MRAKHAVLAGLIAALAGGSIACRGRAEAPAAASPSPRAAAPRAANATFVGREACARCHAQEGARWKGSHHDLAMQEATEKTVLGNFENASFTHYSVTSTFFKRDGKFFVSTDGPEGKLHEYPIAYTFGVYPLQQYLIAFPGGRYQALNVCWDTRPAKEGGQRWFHLYPKEAVPHSDPLHWTGPYQNWNFMCAECHSTNVKKGYSPASNSYATTWSEIDVSCEACHGPGSAHAAWGEAVRSGKAKAGDADKGLALALKDPVKAEWIIDPATGIAKRSVPRTNRTEIEMCGRCHARRSIVAADYEWGKPLLDTHRPALLDRGLYYADGQIQDEVYEYGSFLQSKMYAAGVTCADCHNPHDLKVPVSADRVCAGCHMPEKFDTPAHHFHKASSAGASCVACHMATKNYMVVHARRDHSFRVPRPDLSVTIGSPNACTGCHRDRSPKWAADAALKWWGGKRREEPNYGEAIQAGREVLPGASAALERIAADPRQPAIVRATALTLFGPENGAAPRSLLETALSDADPYVRRGAVAAAATLDPGDRIAMLSPLLRDPILTIRIDAARSLVSVPKELTTSSDRTDVEAALNEYVKSQLADADRPEAHVTLGALAVEQEDLARAEAEYRTALKLVPAFGAAYVNLADLYRSQGRDVEGEKVLRQGLRRQRAGSRHPPRAGAHTRAFEAALRGAAGAPARRGARTGGAALRLCLRDGPRLSGDFPRALRTLKAAHDRHPGDRDVLEALAMVSLRSGDRDAALRYAKRLVALAPEDPRGPQLLKLLLR
ncbi:MAG: tetratricopeptide repeat protein [Thermoanaerobaculia bacterium]